MPGCAKPLDVGSGRVCASFDPRSAAWLSIGAPHPVHGFVELSAMPRFDEAQRGDAQATRLHREAMTRAEHAFLRVEVDGAAPELTPDPSKPAAPRWTAGALEVMATSGPDALAIRQTWRVRATDGPRPSVRIILRGSLDRPALAEITELEPPEPTGATTSFAVHGQSVTINAPLLPGGAVVTVLGVSIKWRIVDCEATATVDPAARERLNFTLEVSMSGPAHPTATSNAIDADEDDPIGRRAMAYIRGCTALAVRPDERAILTDHRILPLSWTRDAYWQALALLAADKQGDRDRVASHLRWLWRRCERPDGRWVRSHHANGRRKDLAFQADQQLYPLVELADYWRLTGEIPAGVAWEREVPRAWEAAAQEIDPETGLLGSAENAADDPAAAPFIAASQILLWYTSERLGELVDAGVLRIDAAAVRHVGAAVRAAFRSRLAQNPGPWPYAVDGLGLRVAYHDANDLPVALAPLWGFCAGDDPGWLATMSFAFGETNPAWFAGDRPGLGSAHTPGPWALGDVQAWIRARVADDVPSMAASLSRLREIAFDDLMLPEAYTADRWDDRRIRHWFAWPGAAIAALLVFDRNGRLAERMAARRFG